MNITQRQQCLELYIAAIADLTALELRIAQCTVEYKTAEDNARLARQAVIDARAKNKNRTVAPKRAKLSEICLGTSVSIFFRWAKLGDTRGAPANKCAAIEGSRESGGEWRTGTVIGITQTKSRKWLYRCVFDTPTRNQAIYTSGQIRVGRDNYLQLQASIAANESSSDDGLSSPDLDNDKNRDHDMNKDQDHEKEKKPDNNKDKEQIKDMDKDQDNDKNQDNDKEKDKDEDNDKHKDQDNDKDQDQDNLKDQDQDTDKDNDKEKEKEPDNDKDKDQSSLDHDDDQAIHSEPPSPGATTDAAAKTLLPPTHRLIHVPRDGHCLFRALGICMPQLASDHQMIRSAIVSHITSHWENTVVPYGLWIRHVYPNETTKTYTHRMEGRRKDYGDYPELVAAADLFQHHVVVLEYVTDSTCFHEIITLDAPSNAAVEKVKKRKKDRRRSNGPELGTYPVKSICKGIDYMRSTGAVPLPGGGFNPIPEHAPEEAPEFYGRDPQPVKFVSAEYKRKRGDDSSSSSESSVNEEEKDIVPAPPATIKKKKRKRKRSGALVQDVLPMAENSDFADMDSISTHKRKKKGKRKHAITVKEGIAVHTSASVIAVPDTTDKAEITSSSTVGDQHGAIGGPEEKAEVLGTNDGCNGNDNRDSGPQPKIVTRDGLWEMKLNRSLGPGEGFVRIKKDIPFSKKKNRNKQQKNWSTAMKRHWNTPEKDKAMAKITIRRRDMHLVRILLTMFSTDRVRFDFQCYFIIGLSQNVFGRRLYNRGLF